MDQNQLEKHLSMLKTANERVAFLNGAYFGLNQAKEIYRGVIAKQVEGIVE